MAKGVEKAALERASQNRATKRKVGCGKELGIEITEVEVIRSPNACKRVGCRGQRVPQRK